MQGVFMKNKRIIQSEISPCTIRVGSISPILLNNRTQVFVQLRFSAGIAGYGLESLRVRSLGLVSRVLPGKYVSGACSGI